MHCHGEKLQYLYLYFCYLLENNFYILAALVVCITQIHIQTRSVIPSS